MNEKEKMKLKVVSTLIVLFLISMIACYISLTILFYLVLAIMGSFLLKRFIILYNKINELGDKFTYSEIGLLLVKKALIDLLSWESKDSQLEPGKRPQLETTMDSFNQLRLKYIDKMSDELAKKEMEKKI